MNNFEMTKAILFIRPNAQFTLTDDKLTWLDDEQVEPTKSEIQAGWVAYQAAQAAETQAKAQAKAALLERLGLTQEEFNTLTA